MGAAVAAALFLAMTAAWVYSYGRVVFIRFYDSGETGYGAAVSNGAVYFIATQTRRHVRSTEPPKRVVQHLMMADVDLYEAQDSSFAGFGLHRERLNWLPVPPGFIRIPFWFPAATLATISQACWKLRGRRQRRIGAGLCPGCGYDLRASPHRCPECGERLEGVPVSLSLHGGFNRTED